MKLYLSLLLICPALLNAEICGLKSDSSNLENTSTLYRGQKEFSMSMLDVIRKATPNENVFFSPYSTYHALLLAYFGSSGDVEKQLVKVLNLNWANNKEAVRSIYRSEKMFHHDRVENMPLEFSSVDRLYFDKRVKLAKCLDDRFHQEIVELDIQNQPEITRQEINKWVENVTHSEIKDILLPGDIDSRTQLVVANAAYFKGQWEYRFDADKTKQMNFYTSNNESSLVPMMTQKGTFKWKPDENLGAHVLQMPFRTSYNESEDSSISMVLILPRNTLVENVLSKLNTNSLNNALNAASAQEIEVSLPKFGFEQRLELVPILREMGLNQLFDSSATFDDFSTEQKITFSDAKHVAKIKVDEEGSTASAATVLVSFRLARPLEPSKFVCDHPFIFMIYDHETNAILFSGIYRDPKTMK